MYIAFDVSTLATILFLVVMEGLLSLDNALVLALVVRHLPIHSQRKALFYGIWGAFIFRFLALFLATRLIASPWLKILGGFYLLQMACKYFFFAQAEEKVKTGKWALMQFWRVVVSVELLDMVFSLDSILASVAVNPMLWVVLTGGILGIVMMRFSSSLFIKLINRFPVMEKVAYVTVGFLGLKLTVQGLLQ